MSKKKFVIYYESGWVGASEKETIEVEMDDFSTKQQLEEYLDDEARNMMSNRAEFGWYEAESDEDGE